MLLYEYVNVFGHSNLKMTETWFHAFLAEQSHVEWFFRADTLLEILKKIKIKSQKYIKSIYESRIWYNLTLTTSWNLFVVILIIYASYYILN
jgi:hypothetical protein